MATITHGLTQMTLIKSRVLSAALLTLTAAGAIWNPATASTQTRHYDVKVDGKPAGNYTLAISTNGDSIDVTSDCSVHQKILLFNYDYKYHGHEVYKANQLAAFNSTSDDNGKHSDILLKRTSDNRFDFTVNKKSGTTSGDTLLSSYWSYPSVDQPKDGFKFFEVDSGRTFKAKIKQLGNESLTVSGKSIACRHVEVTGGDDCELWYSDNRMVRQSSSNLGHKTVIELSRVD